MFEFVWNLLSFIVALGILVTVHEYGHFWVARKNGVQVDKFSIGFGPALWRKKDKKGTEYIIALIPLGGYVKMLDERVDEVNEADLGKTFNRKTVYQRIAIIAAGPFANFAFAIFAFYLMFIIGVPSIKPIIGDIAVGSIAEQAQLPVGSEIISVSGMKTQDWQDVTLALMSNMGSDSITIEAKLAGNQYIKSYLLQTTNWIVAPEKESPLTSIGIQPYRPKVTNVLGGVEKNSPAALAGLQAGDVLISINGQSINNEWLVFSEKIKQYALVETTLMINRNGDNKTLKITPDSKMKAGQPIGYIGVAPKFEPWSESAKVTIHYGVVDALGQSIDKTWNLVTLSFSMIGKLLTGDLSVNNLSGPIAIAQGAGSSAGYGFVYFLSFLALISINLGIINLLPLPVLDGGHLFYYFIELVTGKPVPDNIQEAGFKFGAIILFTLMFVALSNDFSRL
jgi:regulator of sigma E protease